MQTAFYLIHFCFEDNLSSKDPEQCGVPGQMSSGVCSWMDSDEASACEGLNVFLQHWSDIQERLTAGDLQNSPLPKSNFMADTRQN